MTASSSGTEIDADADTIAPARAFLIGVVALTFVMNAVGRGVSETFAVFLLPVEKDLGISRAQISATYSIFMLAYAVAAPFAGQLIDRLGARACYGVGLAAIGIGICLRGRHNRSPCIMSVSASSAA